MDPNYKLTDNQNKLLHSLVGARKCDNSRTSKFINYVLVPLVVLILIILLFIPPVDCALASVIPEFYSRLLFKAFVIFLIVFLLERMVNQYREGKNFCD